VIIYYLIDKNRLRKTAQAATTLLFFSIFQLVFQPLIFAGNSLEKTAAEYRLRGYEEQQRGNLERALEYYTKALAFGEKNAVVFNDIGVLYEQMGLLKKAEENYLRSISVDPQYLPPYTNLAYLYKGQGDTRLAAQYFQQRLEQSSGDDPWYKRIEEELIAVNPGYRKQKIRREAEDLHREMVEKVRDEFSLSITRAEKHYQKGEEHLRAKQYDEALKEFDHALSVTPNNPKIIRAKEEALYEKALLEAKIRTQDAAHMLERGELEAARDEYKKILATIPEEPFQKSE